MNKSAFLGRATIWTLALSAVFGAISWFMWGSNMALGLALGALVGLANLWLLQRAVGQVLQSPEEHRPAAGSKWALPAALLLKWPFLLLALGLILWYMPARPEGVAAGVLLSLLAASIASRVGARG